MEIDNDLTIFFQFLDEFTLDSLNKDLFLLKWNNYLNLNNISAIIFFLAGLKYNLLKLKQLIIFFNLKFFNIIEQSILSNNTGICIDIAYNHLFSIFKLMLSKLEIKNLILLSNDYKKYDYSRFFKTLYPIYQKLPKWVNKLDNEFYTDNYFNPINWNIEQINNNIISKTEENLLDLFSFNNKIDNSILKNICKIAIDSSIESSTNIDRLYGPLNSMDNLSCEFSIDGCRMLSCECYSSEEDTYINLYDWFTGECGKCNSIINDLSHAIRFPCENGGWVGCFCSFNCMQTNKFFPKDDLFELRCENLKYKLKSLGIYNRLK